MAFRAGRRAAEHCPAFKAGSIAFRAESRDCTPLLDDTLGVAAALLGLVILLILLQAKVAFEKK
jgi:hypothetical protein